MREEDVVVVRLTWSEARALLYASSFGIEASDRWPTETYRNQGLTARKKLAAAARQAEPAS